MNKQEVINKLQSSLYPETSISSWNEGYNTGITQAIHTVTELDELDKEVVPQFVADWLEVCKDNLALSLANSMNNVVMRTNNQPDKTIRWIAKNSETFAKAWIYGYEVGKEKLYTVEIPNPNDSGYSKIYLAKNKGGKVELFTRSGYTSIKFADNWKQEENAQLTEAEIKEDFAWLWQFAEEVEECNQER